MDHDLILVGGIVLLALSLPSFLGGWVERRLSRFGVVLFALASAMIAWVVQSRPEGLAFQDIPDIFLGVIARVIN